MFFSLRVSNRIRQAFRACNLPRAVRQDYARFVDLLDLSPAMAKEIALIDSLQAASVATDRAAYEVLRLEFLIATRAVRNGGFAPEFTQIVRRAAVGCAAAARGLALELRIPADQVDRDFPATQRGNFGDFPYVAESMAA
jgi:hypothetical protein